MDEKAPFTRDEPVDLAADAFGHADYARTLVSMAMDKDAPSTIGVFGPWGVGKSTIIGGLQAQLPSSTAFSYFDAWRYEDDSLRRQFLRDVAEQLDHENQLRRGFLGDTFSVENDLRELDVDIQSVEEGLSFSWVRAGKATVVGLCLAAIVFIILQVGVGDSLTGSKLGQRIAASIAAGLVAFAASLFSQVIRVTETQVTQKSLRDPDRFAQTFAALLKALKPTRLVIAVDNLDRCAPENAVRMLSTIKTYLEPTVEANRLPIARSQEQVDKEVVFVIAVDDEALRRHLLDQELEHSVGTGQEEAERYVDEYLAKFFSARLPIRPILLDDIRAYIDSNLDALIKGRHIENYRSLLVQFVSAGLKHNPRRVKQFVNDLESRLRLLQEREKPGGPDNTPGIEPPVSGEVLAVARLALIESEWPGAFEQLQADYRKLEEWEAAARDEQVVWIRPEDKKDAESTPSKRQSAESFAAFLRASSEVKSSNLRALLDLKQSTAEAGLPRFPEFRTAAVTEDWPTIERLLVEATPEDRKHYAERMKAILTEEIPGNLAGGRSVVGAMLTVEAFEEFPNERAAVLGEAVKAPAMRPQIARLEPKRVMAAAPSLNRDQQGEIQHALIERYLDENVRLQDQIAISAALAPVAVELAPRDKTALTGAIQRDDLGKKFAAYADLVEAEPDLLSAGAGQRAMDALAVTDDDGRSTFTTNEPALRVAAMAVPREKDETLENGAIDRVKQVLTDTKAASDEYGSNVRGGLRLLEPLVNASAEQWATLAEQIEQEWTETAIESRVELLKLFQLALARSPEDRKGPLGEGMATRITSEPGAAVATVGEFPEELLEELKDPLLSGLAQVAGEHAQERKEATQLIRKHAGGQAGSILSKSVAFAAASDQPAALQMLDDHDDLLGTEHQKIADAVLEADPPAYTVLARLAKSMSDEQRDELADKFLIPLRGEDADAISALDWLASKADGDRASAAAIVSKVVDRYIARAPSPDASIQQRSVTSLRSIAPYARALTTDEQVQLAEKLVEWLSSGRSLRNGALDGLARMRGLTAKAAEPLVDKLIELDREEAEEDTRVAVLTAANSVKGRRGAHSSQKFHDYRTGLAGGDEQDQSVLRRLDAADQPSSSG